MFGNGAAARTPSPSRKMGSRMAGRSYPSLTKIAKIGLRRSGALTCFEFVRDHGIAHASRKAARGAFHLVALAGFLVRDLGAPEASVDLGEIDIIEAHRDFTPVTSCRGQNIWPAGLSITSSFVMKTP